MAMRKTHVIGLILWRGGLLLVGGYVLYCAVQYALRICRLFGLHIPVALEIGLGLIIAGLLFILFSIIIERIQDARREKKEAGEP